MHREDKHVSLLYSGFWCLTPLSTIFQLYRGSDFFVMEETGVSWENHRHVASHWQTLSHNVVSRSPRHELVQSHNLVVMGTDCTGSWIFNYHTIMTTTAPVVVHWLYTFIWLSTNIDWFIGVYHQTRSISVIFMIRTSLQTNRLHYFSVNRQQVI